MKNFKYETTCITRKQTEERISKIEEEVKAIASVSGDALSYTTVRGIMSHLTALKTKLYRDLDYFDEIDKAMEEAVK